MGTPRSLARVISQATGGHHGRFVAVPVQSDLERRLRSGSSQIGTGRWNQARREAIHILAANAGLERRNSWPIERVSSAWLMILAGLTTVADWIGSMTEFFPPAGAELDLDDYIKRSSMRAAVAIEQLGWGGWRAPESSLALEDLFPIVRQYGARPLQKLVETLKQEITEPSLVLIEAPMGEGKTEAAMALADHWAATRVASISGTSICRTKSGDSVDVSQDRLVLSFFASKA